MLLGMRSSIVGDPAPPATGNILIWGAGNNFVWGAGNNLIWGSA